MSKNKVAFLKASGMNLAAMVAVQGLLVVCCSQITHKYKGSIVASLDK